MHVSTQRIWRRDEVAHHDWFGEVHDRVIDAAGDTNTCQVFRELMRVAQRVTIQHDDGSGLTRVTFIWLDYVLIWDSDVNWGLAHPVRAAFDRIGELEKERDTARAVAEQRRGQAAAVSDHAFRLQFDRDERRRAVKRERYKKAMADIDRRKADRGFCFTCKQYDCTCWDRQ
jgi:hypothetical protein